MFSSNLLPQLPSSINGFSHTESFFDHEKDDVHFNYHQRTDDTFISGDLFRSYNSRPPPVAAAEDVAGIRQDFVRQQQFSEGSGLQLSEDHDDDLLDAVICRYTKKKTISKTDGHSKIYTAGGLRDRRVRLSIDIARKFFCLQNELGFDKASETLDWLLTNSFTAIRDLVEQTNHSSSSTVTDLSKARFLETIKGGSDAQITRPKRKRIPKCVDAKMKKTTRRAKVGSEENVARYQSRAEARARARERTKQKLRAKKLDDDVRTLIPKQSKVSICSNPD